MDLCDSIKTVININIYDKSFLSLYFADACLSQDRSRHLNSTCSDTRTTVKPFLTMKTRRKSIYFGWKSNEASFNADKSYERFRKKLWSFQSHSLNWEKVLFSRDEKFRWFSNEWNGKSFSLFLSIFVCFSMKWRM